MPTACRARGILSDARAVPAEAGRNRKGSVGDRFTTVGYWLRRFLTEHIVTERNLARNTQLSYRDTFELLLPFIAMKARKVIERLLLDDLTGKRVLQFLSHLEEERGCTPRPATSAWRPYAPSPGSSPVAIRPGWNGAVISVRSP